VNLHRRVIATERLGAGWQEERVVLAPDRQIRRQMRPQVGLEGGVGLHIGCVIAEEVELNIAVPRPAE
jgi:hypothetical protein